MANIVEFLVKVKDLASGPLGKISSSGSKSFSQLEQGISKVSTRFNRLGMSIQDIDRKLDQLKKAREISLDGRQLRRINSEMQELERRKARLEGGNSSSGGGIGLGGFAGAALGMAGIAGVGGVIQAGMDQTMTKKTYEVMAGQQQGGQLSSNLLKYAQDTIYGNEVLDIGKTMLAFGIESEKVMPSVQRLGDLAMGNGEKFKSLGLVYSQVAAQGRLMGSDNLQFINAGFNPLQIISEKTGKSMAVLKKEMEEGKISFTDVAGAIETATSKGGKFYNMTNELAKTAPGKLMGLQGAFEGFTAKAGASLLEMLVPLIELASWLLENTKYIKAFGGGLLAAVVAFKAITLATTLWQLATGKLTLAQLGLNSAMLANPIFWIAAVIGGLVATIIYCWETFEGFRGFLYGFWESFKQIFSNIGNFFKMIFSPVMDAINAFQNPNLSAWEKTKIIGASMGKMVYNLSPVGMAANLIQFTAEGGLTKGVAGAFKKGQAKGIAAFRAEKARERVAELEPGSDTGLGAGDGLGLAGAMAPPDSAKASANGITGGGVRNLSINVSKFFDDLHFHSASSNEGMKDIEAKFKEMFMRVVNSGNAVIA